MFWIDGRKRLQERLADAKRWQLCGTSVSEQRLMNLNPAMSRDLPLSTVVLVRYVSICGLPQLNSVKFKDQHQDVEQQTVFDRK